MLKVLFMGTPDFARDSLKAIHEKGHEILSVITVPDRPKGRGMKLIYSEVKEYAIENGLEVIQPDKLRGNEEIIEKINEQNREVVFLGDGVPVFTEYIEAHCKVPYTFAPPHMNKQRAGAVAALGMVLYQNGTFESAAEHKPDYLRLSQAERELKERQG